MAMDDRSIRLRWIGFLEDDAIKPTAGTNFLMDRLLASDALQAPAGANLSTPGGRVPAFPNTPGVAFHV